MINARTTRLVGLLALVCAAALTLVLETGVATADDGQVSSAVVSLSAGYQHACALTSEQEVLCWGLNGAGQTDVPEGRYRAVSAGSWHTCALTVDGEVRCWGLDQHGQLDAPVGQFSAVSAGFDHSCAIREDDQRLICWGGGGSLHRIPEGRFQALDAGRSHSCALALDTTIQCWGSNERGESESPSTRYKQVVTLQSNTCGLTTSGAVECWGAAVGREPTAQEGTYKSISGRWGHVCGITFEDEIHCWHLYKYSADQAGETLAPVGRYTAVAAGYRFSCALTQAGTVRCWGAEDYGHHFAPEGTFNEVSAGHFFTCGIEPTGSLVCWGGKGNAWAESGHEERWRSQQFRQVNAGSSHVCALTEEDRARCWTKVGYHTPGITDVAPGRYASLVSNYITGCGLNVQGQAFCWGPFEDVNATPLGEWNSLSTSYAAACGIRPDGQIECWGSELGTPPVGSFESLSLGRTFGCAIDTDHQLLCWGRPWFVWRHGWSETPIGSYAAIDAGPNGYCALSTDGDVICYASVHTTDLGCGERMPGQGLDEHCRFARGDWTRAPNPPYISVTTGADHACALKADGALDCWILLRKPTAVPERIVAPPLGDMQAEDEHGDPAGLLEMEVDEPVERLGRIATRRLNDGRIEFAFDPAEGERVLPSSRFFPADSPVGRWRHSSPVVIDGVEWGRISAQRRAGGELELSFVAADGTRILPRSRIFPPSAPADRWLRSNQFDAVGE